MNTAEGTKTRDWLVTVGQELDAIRERLSELREKCGEVGNDPGAEVMFRIDEAEGKLADASQALVRKITGSDDDDPVVFIRPDLHDRCKAIAAGEGVPVNEVVNRVLKEELDRRTGGHGNDVQ
jgi:hypothetical protein